jgi:hypothetical protein
VSVRIKPCHVAGNSKTTLRDKGTTPRSLLDGLRPAPLIHTTSRAIQKAAWGRSLDTTVSSSRADVDAAIPGKEGF